METTLAFFLAIIAAGVVVWVIGAVSCSFRTRRVHKHNAAVTKDLIDRCHAERRQWVADCINHQSEQLESLKGEVKRLRDIIEQGRDT